LLGFHYLVQPDHVIYYPIPARCISCTPWWSRCTPWTTIFSGTSPWATQQAHPNPIC